MAVRNLVIAPDPLLNIASESVAEVDDDTRALMDDMLETMYEHKGIGLAAVQVGVHKRVIVVDVGAGSRYEDSKDYESDPLFLVNPEIVASSQEGRDYEEGCLSFPGQFSTVRRPDTVQVKYLDYNGKQQELAAEGLLSTCIQHEIDHINGIVFVDHISKLKRDMILRRLQKVKRLAGA